MDTKTRIQLHEYKGLLDSEIQRNRRFTADMLLKQTLLYTLNEALIEGKIYFPIDSDVEEVINFCARNLDIEGELERAVECLRR